jgi:hypothetical protein
MGGTVVRTGKRRDFICDAHCSQTGIDPPPVASGPARRYTFSISMQNQLRWRVMLTWCQWLGGNVTIGIWYMLALFDCEAD